MTRTKRTRIFALAGVVALSISLAVPVSAKPKPKPIETVTVAMTYVGAGIATTTDCSGPLTMKQERRGVLRTDWAGDANSSSSSVEITLPELLVGCHGGLIDDSHDGFAGYFILAPNPDGTIELTSRFDYYWEYDLVEKGNSGKFTEVQTELQFFEINAVLDTVTGEPPFDWSARAVPQEVEGTLKLRSFDKFDVGWVDLSDTWVEMTITISD